MILDHEQRAALRAMADKLRTEVSSLNAERDAAYAEQSTVADDAKLIAEIKALQTQRDAAQEQRDVAVSNTDSALSVMQAMIEEQMKTTALGNAGSSEPALAESDDKHVELEVDPELGSETLVSSDKHGESTITGPLFEKSNKPRGGNR